MILYNRYLKTNAPKRNLPRLIGPLRTKMLRDFVSPVGLLRIHIHHHCLLISARSLRIYPHLQDTGGFFIAVLQKAPSTAIEQESAASEVRTYASQLSFFYILSAHRFVEMVSDRQRPLTRQRPPKRRSPSLTQQTCNLKVMKTTP